MQIIARRTLRQFWEQHPDAESPLRSWYATVLRAEWTTPADVKAQFGSADVVSDSRVIFNIGGNKYRLVVHVAYGFKRVLVKFVGTHAEYDEIDAADVNRYGSKKKRKKKRYGGHQADQERGRVRRRAK